MKLLMHICCANCALIPVQTLKKRGDEVKGYWYNPNIHPYPEYTRRLSALRQLQGLWGMDIAYNEHYGLREFIVAVDHDRANRCEHCYAMRLDETARMTREQGLGAFTTSLLVSPYQKHEKVLAAGGRAAEKHNVEFVAEDFRPGYRDGVALSRDLGLYRQNYCGCMYSEQDRSSRERHV